MCDINVLIAWYLPGWSNAPSCSSWTSTSCSPGYASFSVAPAPGGAVPRSSSARGLLHVPPMLPCALLAAVLLHGGVLPATLLPEHCILGTVRRGRAGQDSAARPAGFRHSLPRPARLGRLGERSLPTTHALAMLAATLLKSVGYYSYLQA